MNTTHFLGAAVATTRVRRGGVVVCGVCLLGALLWLLGVPQHVYQAGYVTLAYPVQILGESAQALGGKGQPHLTDWSRWTANLDLRYVWLQSPARRDMGGPIALEAGVLGLVVALVAWRVLWFCLTRVGEIAPSAAHGDARWMTAREMRALPYRRRPLLLGQCGRTSLAVPPELQVLGALLVGPPGSGKSAGIFIPNLLREDGTRSVVVTDLKGELLRTCGDALARRHEVWSVNFLSPATSRGYNPLASCIDPLTTALFCDAWIGNTGRSEKEPFWDNAAREIMMAGIAHLQATLPALPTLTHLTRFLCSQAPLAVITTLEASPSPLARDKARSFMAALKSNERLLGSAFAEISPRFMIMSDPRVQATTSMHEVDFARLVDPVRQQRPVALFLQMDRTLQDELKPLAAAFFLDLFHALSTASDATPHEPLPRGVYIYADEFGNLGAVPKMATWVSTLRSAGVGMLLAVQSTAQLVAAYGEEGATTIKGASATKIGLSSMGDADARWFSDLSGQTTVVTQQASRQRGRFHAIADRGGESQSESKGQLLTPDQVRRMGKTELLAVIGEMPPVRLTQRRWYADPEVKERGGASLLPQRPVPLVPPAVSPSGPSQPPRDALEGETDRDLPRGPVLTIVPPFSPLVPGDQEFDRDA